MRAAIFGSFLALLALAAGAKNPAASGAGPCGEVLSIETRSGSAMRYALALPTSQNVQSAPVTLVLLAGGAGHLDLDDKGCARKLAGNSLVRSARIFNAAGFATVLVDAPADHQGEDGLGGYRVDAQHAQDLGLLIAHLRQRVPGSVWVIGTSRGAISAANAASRLSLPQAPDGVVLTSALMAGDPRARKRWVAHSVFDLPLDNIRMPVLVVGHAEDKCARSPATQMEGVVAQTQGVREQVVLVTGGPGRAGPVGIDACEGRTPHGYTEQEEEVAAGIARFVRGGRY